MNLLLVLTFLSLINTAQPIGYTPQSAKEIVYAYAVHYAINGDELFNTLNCESQMEPEAVGDHHESYGVAQIHLPAHQDISKTQALDPLFSIDWAAHEFALGNANIWTCHRLLYGGNSPSSPRVTVND